MEKKRENLICLYNKVTFGKTTIYLVRETGYEKKEEAGKLI